MFKLAMFCQEGNGAGGATLFMTMLMTLWMLTQITCGGGLHGF
jgi:hypothetical protein